MLVDTAGSSSTGWYCCCSFRTQAILYIRWLLIVLIVFQVWYNFLWPQIMVEHCQSIENFISTPPHNRQAPREQKDCSIIVSSDRCSFYQAEGLSMATPLTICRRTCCSQCSTSLSHHACYSTLNPRCKPLTNRLTTSPSWIIMI